MLGADPIEMMRANVADLRAVRLIPGIGHWTQQEAPQETTRLLLDWLAEV
jgi:pimeloyl-ACP methyl ester carboxylesterase